MNFEEIVQEVVNSLELAESSRFDIGDLLNANDQLNCKLVASSVGRSTAYLNELKFVASVFPAEQRAKDQSWSLHRLCARTSNPEGWLNRACEEGFSIRTLREALIGAGELNPRGSHGDRSGGVADDNVVRPGDGHVQLENCPNCGFNLEAFIEASIS